VKNLGLADLTQVELLYGSFSFIFVVISIIMGLKILIKYFELKRVEFITIGLAWVFMTSGWWRISLNFPLVILFDTEVPHIIGITIDSIFIPVAILCWMYSFCTLVYPNSLKKVMTIYLLICVIYEIILVYLIITDPDQVVTIISTFNSKYNLYPYLFSIFGILTFIVTGIIFAMKSVKSEDPKIRWKSKFLLLAFILFTIGAIFDAGIRMDVFTLVAVRSILIISSILYYMGFLLPDKVSNWLIKEK
jgi:hypothetical protein